MLWFLLACAPGKVETPKGEEPLLTAFYLTRPANAGAEAVILLVNSSLDCALLPDTEDPNELIQAQAALQAALTREGAKAAVLRLYRYTALAPTWPGLYPLYTSAGHQNNGGDSPLSSGAAWFNVLEAELDDEDGLYRTYTPLEVEYEDPVAAPGWVRISRADEEQLVGTFSLDSLHASGSFRALNCGTETALFDYLDLLAQREP